MYDHSIPNNSFFHFPCASCSAPPFVNKSFCKMLWAEISTQLLYYCLLCNNDLTAPYRSSNACSWSTIILVWMLCNALWKLPIRTTKTVQSEHLWLALIFLWMKRQLVATRYPNKAFEKSSEWQTHIYTIFGNNISVIHITRQILYVINTP